VAKSPVRGKEGMRLAAGAGLAGLSAATRSAPNMLCSMWHVTTVTHRLAREEKWDFPAHGLLRIWSQYPNGYAKEGALAPDMNLGDGGRNRPVVQVKFI